MTKTKRATKDTVSVIEASRLLSYDPIYTYRLVQAGRIKAEKRDGKWLVDRASVEERIARRRNAA